MRVSLPIRPLLRGWLYSFLVFGGLACVLIGQLVLTMSMPVADALQMAVRDWLPWALLTPLLFLFVFHFPLEKDRWKSTALLQVLCAAGTLGFCIWWADVLLPHRPEGRRAGWEFPPPDAPPRPPLEIRPGRPPHPPRPGPFGAFFPIASRLPIYLALVSIAHAFCFYRRARERELRSLGLEAGLAKARLEALRMQLQPHFLFNSLNAIAELVHRDAEAADAMLVALGDLLRLTLETSGEQELPLRRELEFVERYLAIEKVRLGGRLRVEFDIAPETREALVPVFLLQPLVENAVRHGLEPKAPGGTLTIRAALEGSALHLSISDNGIGLPADRPLTEGIGHANTRARLAEIHGSAANMTLRNKDGVTVEITLPFQTAATQATKAA